MESEQSENIRKKRSASLSYSAGVKEIEKVLRFVVEYDFGNTFYDGHFMSDLLVGLDVLRDWKSTRMSNYVTARSVFFTSGLGFIYPSDVKQEFEPLLTADFANSSIWQRVLDSHGLIFWIQPHLTEPIIPIYEEVPVFTFPPTESTEYTETTETWNNTTVTPIPEEFWSGLPPIPGFEVTQTDSTVDVSTATLEPGGDIWHLFENISTPKLNTKTEEGTATIDSQSTESMLEETLSVSSSPVEGSEQTTLLESSTLFTISTTDEPSTLEATASRIKREVSDKSFTTSSTSESIHESVSSSDFISSTVSSFESSTNLNTLSSAAFPISQSSTDSTDVEVLSEETDSIIIGSSYPAFTSDMSAGETSTESATTTPEPEIIDLPKVTVFLGAQASQNEITNVFAVTGLTLNETYLQQMLQRFPNCDDEDTCYFLDDAAFVMAVNREKLNYQVGYFLGYVDPPLMESLLDNKVYSRVKYYDYQAICDFAHLGEKNCTSPAMRLIPNVVRNFAQIFNPRFWLSLIKQLASLFIQLANMLVVFSQMCSNAFAIDQKIDYVNCVKSTYRYYPTDGANFGKKPVDTTEITGIFTCSPECTRKWSATSVPYSNLKFIRTDKICACIKKDYDWQLTPSIADDISICQSAPRPRYRRPVNACDI
ncbi:unnamed protein product [Hymenolepis diminuta]|uniref:Voltage-dependent calcium channel alpha-2/delta subunit conserved region domain-containing protein n=1 Tax=Hymenolepis diminuta TaxID=6216 RepID=A0A564Z4K3_HYMDI|nr:unnamed protein product [Hymenolepis diminuta]